MSEDAFRRLFSENPMLMEATRFKRRFLGEARHSGIYRTYLVLALIIYLLIVAVSIAFRSGLTSGAIIEFQSGLYCLVVPAVTYGAVAGEREKRTWELLIVAPITKTQIVVGKFLSAAMVVLTVALFTLPVAAFGFNRESETILGVICGYFDSIAFGLGLTAVCLLISSRTNRSLTAQVLIYSSIFIWLFVFPMILGLASFGSDKAFNNFMWMHPFVSVWALCTKSQTASGYKPGYLWGPGAQVIFYAALIMLALLAAIKSIESVDGTERFSNA